MRVTFTPDAWDDYQHWVATDRAVLAKINAMIADARRHPFEGIGKPEPLQRNLAGWWSRRITHDHRLVYRVTGTPRADQTLEIAACRYHYADR